MTTSTRVVNSSLRMSTDTVLPELRAALEEQWAFRAEQLLGLAAPAGTGPDDDPRDEVTDALRAAAMSAVRDIEAALARMDAGRYGTCETCRDDVPLERLEILPMAALCMPCARAQHAGRRG